MKIQDIVQFEHRLFYHKAPNSLKHFCYGDNIAFDVDQNFQVSDMKPVNFPYSSRTPAFCKPIVIDNKVYIFHYFESRYIVYEACQLSLKYLFEINDVISPSIVAYCQQIIFFNQKSMKFYQADMVTESTKEINIQVPQDWFPTCFQVNQHNLNRVLLFNRLNILYLVDLYSLNIYICKISINDSMTTELVHTEKEINIHQNALAIWGSKFIVVHCYNAISYYISFHSDFPTVYNAPYIQKLEASNLQELHSHIDEDGDYEVDDEVFYHFGLQPHILTNLWNQYLSTQKKIAAIEQ